MKNRSELREVAMKALYQVYIYENTDTKYEVNEIIKSLLEVENDFVNDLVNGVIANQETISNLANKH